MTTAATRVLVAARLSRVPDPDNPGKSRIDRDDDRSQKWADDNGCRIVGYATDAGVSGSVSPWDRKGLGPWLSDPTLMVQYDVIVASSIDRVGRSARDLHDLQSWAEDHHKTLRILSPALVWPPDADDLAQGFIWDVLARVAEVELRLIKGRYANVRQTLIDNEALIGNAPWGYRIVGPKLAKTLEPDPALVPYLAGMVERAMRDDTYRSIARWLDTEGVEPVKGGTWSPKSVINILRNPALKGRRVDADGRVLLKFKSLLSASEWDKLQKALDDRAPRRGPITPETPLLTGVIECDRCGLPMYRSTSTIAGKRYAYYRCSGTAREPSKCANAVKTDDIEEWVNRWFTHDGPFASTEIVEQIVTPGDDHGSEVAEIESEIRELDLDAEDYEAKSRSLRAERARLKALPSQPAQVEERPTGRTVGEVWAGLTEEAKRGYLVATGVKVRVRSNAALRKDDGAEVRYLTGGDPHKVIGSLQKLTASAALPL